MTISDIESVRLAAHDDPNFTSFEELQQRIEKLQLRNDEMVRAKLHRLKFLLKAHPTCQIAPELCQDSEATLSQIAHPPSRDNARDEPFEELQPCFVETLDLEAKMHPQHALKVPNTDGAQQALAVGQTEEATLQPAVFFESFGILPTEIQNLIWDASLPGPRVLKVRDMPYGHPSIVKDRLDFLMDGQSPNPAALYVCRASRARALLSYKLSFGTPHIYADLAGGDILQFGTPKACPPQFWSQNHTEERTHLSDEVWKDLNAVRHVILPLDGWARQTYADILRGVQARASLDQLQSLERVSVTLHVQSNRYRSRASYVVHPDPFFEQAEKVCESKLSPDLLLLAHILSGFLSSDMSYHARETFAKWTKRRQNILGCTVALNFISGFELLYKHNPQDGPLTLPTRVLQVRLMELEYASHHPATP